MAKKTAYASGLIFFIGVFFSFVTSMSVYDFENKAIQQEIKKDIENAAFSISRELNIGIELLHALRSQIIFTQHLDQAQFNALSLQILKRQPEIKSIKWVDWLVEKNKADYEKQLGAETDQHFIKQLSEKGEMEAVASRKNYFPVRYVYPDRDYNKMLGLDLGSDASTRRAIETSWYRGIPIVLSGFWLKREFQQENGLIVILPGFKGEPTTNRERKAALEGFLVTLFDVKKIFALSIDQTVRRNMSLSLIEKGVDQDHRIIFESHSQRVVSNDNSPTFMSSPIYFAGREWFLVGTPSTDFIYGRLTLYPQTLFILGVILFSILAYLIFVIQSRAVAIQMRVDEKTRELSAANRKLEKMSKSDGLTGFYNKEYFLESLDVEIKRAQRDRFGLTVLLIDIDNMSKYIDINGQIAGNNIVRLIGQALHDTLQRPGDLFARCESGKFVVLLPNTLDASSLAERCLDAIRKLNIPFDLESESTAMSISIGGVTAKDTDELSSTRMIALAENALAKAIVKGGDNQHWIRLSDGYQSAMPVDSRSRAQD